VSNIPTPFVGGTDSPRRGSDEEKTLQPPFAPGGEAFHGSDGPESDDDVRPEEAVRLDVEDLDEEDLLPDMSSEGEDIAIEGPTYDLEWPEGPEPETASEVTEMIEVAPEAEPAEDPARTRESTEVAGSGADMPDFLLGPDSGAAEEAEPIEEETVLPKERLVEMAAKLQEGALGESIRVLIGDLSVYTPEIAVPRAFAAGYLAAKKEEEM
jgi:hypothetical protein